jgi:hypothetical protein
MAGCEAVRTRRHTEKAFQLGRAQTHTLFVHHFWDDELIISSKLLQLSGLKLPSRAGARRCAPLRTYLTNVLLRPLDMSDGSADAGRGRNVHTVWLSCSCAGPKSWR